MHVSGQLADRIIDWKTDVPFHHLVIEEDVKFIGQWNFMEWDQLEEVTIPSSVEEIGHAAFWKCKNLKRVNLSEGLVEIGEYAFDECPCEDAIC